MNAGVQIIDLKAQADHRPVYQVVLSNACAKISLFSFGATLQSFVIDIPGFEKRDIVLGYPDWTNYQHTFAFSGNAYMGNIIGPIAGRVANAQIPWGAGTWPFTPNEGPHLLHGGPNNFSNHNWKVKHTPNAAHPTITFELEEKEKFRLPGGLRCAVTYTLRETALDISIETFATDDTIANPTQHCYFNPNGHQGSILDTAAFIRANGYLELNTAKLPTGQITALSGENQEGFVALNPLYDGLDHAFVLNAAQNQAQLLAQDGFRLAFSTNQPLFQVYIGGQTPFVGKDHTNYHRFSGICLEQQAEPDAPHHENFSDIYLSKDQKKVNLLTIQFDQ